MGLRPRKANKGKRSAESAHQMCTPRDHPLLQSWIPITNLSWDSAWLRQAAPQAVPVSRLRAPDLNPGPNTALRPNRSLFKKLGQMSQAFQAARP